MQQPLLRSAMSKMLCMPYAQDFSFNNNIQDSKKKAFLFWGILLANDLPRALPIVQVRMKKISPGWTIYLF